MKSIPGSGVGGQGSERMDGVKRGKSSKLKTASKTRGRGAGKRREKNAGKENLIDEREKPRFIFVVLIQNLKISATPKPCDMSARSELSPQCRYLL